MQLKNKVIVITGASRGIGLETAKECCRRGASVFICSRNLESVESAVYELRNGGYKAEGMAIDIASANGAGKVFHATLNAFNKIDVWINNAGISHDYYPVNELSDEQIKNVLSTNIDGVLWSAKAVLPYFQKNGGILINVNGMGSDLKKAPYTSIYAATKAAVHSLTKSLAAENKEYPVSVLALMPGIVQTDLVNNVKYSPDLNSHKEIFQYVSAAFGNPIKKVADAFADAAALTPGEKNGKEINLLKGFRLFKGILLISWYGLTGKLKY